MGNQPSSRTHWPMMVQRSSAVGVTTTQAPYACMSVFMVSGTWGTVKMMQGRPAAAAYAAAAAPWLPVEAMVTAGARSYRAFVTSREQMRSL